MIKLVIITPEKIISSEEVDEVTIPTTEGEITVLPGHIGLVTKIMPGELTVKRGSKSESFAITGGFAEVAKDHVSILGEYAIRATDIEIAKAESAQKKAELAMKEKSSEQNFALAEGELRRSILELKIARKRRSL